MRDIRPPKAMTPEGRNCWIVSVAALLHVAVLLQPLPAEGVIMFGPEETVKADGSDIDVLGYSVPSFVDWDNDGLKDLIVGEGSGSSAAKVGVYLNIGTATAPVFSKSSPYCFYTQYTSGGDLVVPGADGCLGAFPRVVYWNDDNKKDLLAGQGIGKISLYLNTGTDEDPTFDGGTLLQIDDGDGGKEDIDVGSRATCSTVDWNNDGKKDVISGELYGMIRLFINEGTDTAPDFQAMTNVKAGGSDLDVGYRSSPVFEDLDGDGKKDLLVAETNGKLYFYSNTGTDAAPAFSGRSFAQSNGADLDLSTTRPRPFVCDWTGDGLLDVLIGDSDGKVRLFQAPIPGDTDNDRDVDGDDAQTLADNWGDSVSGGYTMGDLDGDEVVGPADASILAAHFGHGTGESTAVPEPSTLAMLIIVGMSFLAHRRRR